MNRVDIKRIFRVLLKHQELIATSYLETDGEIAEEADTEKAINELVSARLAWRPDEEVRLSHSLVHLLNSSLRSVRRSHIDSDIGGRMNDIEGLINNYKAAKKYEDKEELLRSLREQIHDLSETLLNATRNLWNQIDSEFGYVSTLEMKSLENKRVLTQVMRLNNSLGMINRADLNKLAGNDPSLRRWLTKVLPLSVERCQAELNDALHRLKDMLFKFRHLQLRGRIVQTLYAQYQQNTGFQPNYAESSDIPLILNSVAPLKMTGSANVGSDEQEVLLTDIIAGARKERVPEEQVVEQKIPVTGMVPVEIVMPVSILRENVIDFFKGVIEHDRDTAMSRYEEVSTICSPELWLYALITGYNNMSDKDRSIFKVVFKEIVDPVLNGRYFVRDIEVACRE